MKKFSYFAGAQIILAVHVFEYLSLFSYSFPQY